MTKGRKALKASCIQMCASVFTFTIFKKKKMKITFQSSCLLRLQFAKKKKHAVGSMEVSNSTKLSSALGFATPLNQTPNN